MFLLPNPPLHHIVCGSASSSLASSLLPWVVQCWLLLLVGLCGSDLIWRNCRRSIRKPTGERGFLCSLAGAQATYPTPAVPGLSSLGRLLPWSTCTSHPKLLLSNESIKEMVCLKCFGEGVTALDLITWHCKGF